MAAVRPRCCGEGVSPALTGRRGWELMTPAVGLRSRRCVVKPDPIAPLGQSSRGAAEGEGRFPTAMVFYLKTEAFILVHFFHSKQKIDWITTQVFSNTREFKRDNDIVTSKAEASKHTSFFFFLLRLVGCDMKVVVSLKRKTKRLAMH